ncbi:DUF1641 domain-containing protein [Halomicrococcus gelatinilyticus]|uniref:DUF1641 domain-containing protein n=1 Tax=Halomicrococcus gelatinilyticus TaxID=1702103 RepID=UPI002E15AA7D
MAEPTQSYPDEATNGATANASGDGATTNGDRNGATSTDGEAALRDALDEHGDDLAAVIERSDDVGALLETAILVVASADDEEVEYVTQSTANLVAAVDGLSTDGAAALATDLGENADELADALDTVVALQREGHLDDLVTIATSFSESLSPAEIAEFATLLEANGSETVEALDVVLDLQREGHLEDLVDLATTLSTLDIDPETARGLNTVLGAVGEAERESEPVGIVGALGELRSRDARAGLGYLVALVKAQGRRLRR